MAFLPLTVVVLFAMFVAASFFFALAETALFTLGKWQLRQMAGRKQGALVQQLLTSPQDLLASIVLGNTFANTGIVAAGVWLILHEAWPVGPVLGAMVLAVLVVGEVIPKTLAVRAPETWAARIALPILTFQKLTRPVRQVAQGMDGWILSRFVRAPAESQAATTAEDYAELVDLATQQGALAPTEKEIILQIVSLDRRTAKDVMVPRSQMSCLADDLSVEELVAAARRLKHRRIPLFDASPDTIVGILNTRVLLLDPQVDLSEAIEFPSFVPESMNLLVLLNSLQRQKRGLAVVLDEFGTTAGLVTIQDILGVMVGHIHDDANGDGFIMQRLGPGRWRVNGTMRIEDFHREYPEIGDYPEVDTMGGLVIALAEQVPPQGHTVTFRGLRLTASVADERRVREVLVEAVRKGGDASA